MKKLLVSTFFVVALIERVWLDLGPNVELITLSSMLAAFYLNKKVGFVFLIVTMFLSDLIIGNTNIFLFTWSGFLIPMIIIGLLPKLKSSRKAFTSLFAGISSNLFFFIWTNFGVWAFDSWGMYPKTITGLVQSYINALPFLKNQLISTFVFVPMGFLVFELVYKKIKSLVMKSSSPFNFIPDSFVKNI